MENKNNAVAIINEWKGMEPEQQIKFCANCVKKAIKSGRRIGNGYEFEDMVQSTWEAVEKRTRDIDGLEADSRERMEQGKVDTLATVISRAANATLENSRYHGRKNSKAISLTITNEGGDELDILDTIAAIDNTEGSAIIRATLQQFIASRDTNDQQIIQGKVDGLTEREIAAIVGISGPAINKRIAKIRVALASIIF